MGDKEVKKITLGHVLSWIFGTLFLLSGAINIINAPFSSMIIILCSIMIIPYFNKIISEKLGFELSGGIKFVLVIIILITIGISEQKGWGIYNGNVDPNQVPMNTGQDSSVNQQIVPQVTTTPLTEQITVTPSPTDEQPVPPVSVGPITNIKTEYIKKYVKLENVEVGEGYGQFDVPGYSKEKPTVEGRIRNTGNLTLETVEITIYFLDSKRTRIGEKQYTPISPYSFFGDDDTPLKPNYVRDWGYVIDDAPAGWAKNVGVIVSDITFSEE